MRKSANKVLLFEDDPEFGPKIEAAIRSRLPAGVELARFQSQQNSFDTTYEDALRDELAKRYPNIVLIVSDRDLSRTANYKGLSEAIISKIAAELGLPICLYARGNSDSVLERQKTWGDGRIVLDSDDLERMAATIRQLVDGFQEIDDTLTKIQRLKGKARPPTPASVMANLLQRPELADKIALYGSGDQKMVAEILPFATNNNPQALKKRLPCLLGYWLYDSILGFPGLLVNSVAAASYLNIPVDVFSSNQKIQSLFKDARYHGPFADGENPLWWRGVLDDILFSAGCKDGRALAERKLKRKIGYCPCSLNPKIPAGYYCVATKTAVSAENSKGNISWFPPGADLSRVRIDVFEDIGPWLGLY